MARTRAKRERVPCPRCGRTYGNVSSHLRLSTCGQELTSTQKGLPPGTIVGQGTGTPYKVPWTREMLEKEFPKELIRNPPESTPVTWNGVTYRIESGQDIQVPAPIAALYWDSQRQKAPPVLRPHGSSLEERAGQVAHQGYGLLAPIAEEG